MFVTKETRGQFGIQSLVSLAFALVTLACSNWRAAVSALLGGLIITGSGIIFAWFMGRKIYGITPVGFIGLLFIAELAKLASVVIALLLVWLFFREVNWLWEVMGCIAALAAYWLTLFINTKRR